MVRSSDVKIRDTKFAVDEGATEIDMVTLEVNLQGNIILFTMK